MSFETELEKRLEKMTSQQDEIEQQLSGLNNKHLQLTHAIEGARALLILENGIDSPAAPVNGAEGPALKDILNLVMVPGMAFSVDDLVDRVSQTGFDFGLKAPRKAVNFTLMGIARGGTVERNVETKEWMRVAKAA